MNEFLKKTREDLHKIPEISKNEFKTSAYIRNMLKSFGFDFTEIETSTVVCIKGETDTWIAFRADIDALPMKEENDVPYKSTHDGVMHSCGHDGHTTNLLYFAKWISESLKNGVKLKKSIMLIFQANEEGTGGAKAIAEHDVYKNKNIEAIFGMHLFPELPEGSIGTVPGVMSAQSIMLDVEIQGKGCHGAQAYNGIDSILVAAKLVEAYQSVPARNVPLNDGVIITVGAIHGGTVRNIIPEKVEMLVTIRVFSKKNIDLVINRLKAIHRGLEVSYGVKIIDNFEIGYPSIMNDKKLFDIVSTFVPQEKLYTELKLSGSEDFSYYTENGVPGLFFGLGTGNKEKGFTYSLHNPKFDFDPEALELSFEIFKKLLNKFEAI